MKQPHKIYHRCPVCKAYLFTDGFEYWCENLNCATNKQEEIIFDTREEDIN